MPGISSYAIYSLQLKKTPEEQRAQFGKRTDVQREVENFKARAAAAKTPQDLLNDFRSLKFILTAFDMEGSEEYPARARQILLGDPTDPRALVNRMSDQRNRVINVAFAFAKTNEDTGKVEYNVDKLKDQSFIDDVVQRYLRAGFRGSFAESSPAVSDAFYFKQVIGNARSAFQLLADPGLRDVIMTSTGMPRDLVRQPVDRQAKFITQNFDLTRVGDKDYIEKVIRNYLARKDAADLQQEQGGRSTLLGIFA